MGHNDHDQTIDRFTRGIIRRKIKQLVGRAGFTKGDEDDLTQDLILRVLQSLPSFNPDQAHRNVFITTVVERYTANLLRNRRAKKRDHSRVSSLHVLIDMGEDGQVELAHTIGQQELDARRGRYPRCEEDLAQLQEDLVAAMAALPERLRDLAERLKTKNVSQVAREMGVSRSTVDGWVRKLRRRFENAGLQDYL